MTVYDLEKLATGWSSTFPDTPPLRVGGRDGLALYGCVAGIGGPTEVANLRAGDCCPSAHDALVNEAKLLAHCRNNFMKVLEALHEALAHAEHECSEHGRKGAMFDYGERIKTMLPELEGVE